MSGHPQRTLVEFCGGLAALLVVYVSQQCARWSLDRRAIYLSLTGAPLGRQRQRGGTAALAFSRAFPLWPQDSLSRANHTLAPLEVPAVRHARHHLDFQRSGVDKSLENIRHRRGTAGSQRLCLRQAGARAIPACRKRCADRRTRIVPGIGQAPGDILPTPQLRAAAQRLSAEPIVGVDMLQHYDAYSLSPRRPHHDGRCCLQRWLFSFLYGWDLPPLLASASGIVIALRRCRAG